MDLSGGLRAAAQGHDRFQMDPGTIAKTFVGFRQQKADTAQRNGFGSIGQCLHGDHQILPVTAGLPEKLAGQKVQSLFILPQPGDGLGHPADKARVPLLQKRDKLMADPVA